MATGNTAILKGPEFSPQCYWGFSDVFREAGLPDGVLNTIFHRPSDAAAVTEQLIAHPAIKKINFTGSSKVGSIISASAGKHLKPVLMELGGKASAIVMKDADLENAALQCTLGAFLNVSEISTLIISKVDLTFQTRLVKFACLLSAFLYIRLFCPSSNQF